MRPVYRYLATAITSAILISTGGCSSRDIVDPNKLCRMGAGLAARITGAPQPIEICVANSETDAQFIAVPTPHYEVSGVFTTSDSTTISLVVIFAVHPNIPVELDITSDLAAAMANPDGVFFGYRETAPPAQDTVSTAVTGRFTLTFSDDSIAVATFDGLTITLEDAASPGTIVGTRTISEGFLNVSAD